MSTVAQNADDATAKFRKHWQSATADSNLTLHGFRRFKTSHLLNLRFLEDEIAELDHVIYQAGLSLNVDRSPTDRLGLRHSKRDKNVPRADAIITRGLVLRLRDLIKQYDEALVAFNNIMAMETFSLLDDEKQSSLQTDLSLYEIYNTRLLRIDLGTRSRTDPFQRWIHKWLRAFRYRRLSKKSQGNVEGLGSFEKGHRWSYQNTILVADIIGRGVTAMVTAIFLIAPLAILSQQSLRDTQLLVISLCIVVFSFLVAVMLKVSNFEMMAVSAAYAAVLSAFMSNAS
ncbi:uncharacterized protein BCR38DRAFT_337104 [Pseudomassariella vexata]|uniref:DUF6594 domain-containing protein n=1 Tax=Pseudomassariella vexata TaxID=1141098 RepID=A0A1Y2E8A2_9PEZI|nr:uncharacterized protein BCR38DRAFT_337104 [Pseudomassariella vexata]ORY67657.1 hypothetical protein BCR38DRAFT_337104 [Pseudomassariella vexata]